MKESHFNTEVVNSLKHFGYFAYKLGDQVPTPGSRFIPEKPCDIVSCSPRGVFIAIESKQLKKWASLNHKILRQNQVDALDKVVKRKGKAFLFLNIRVNKPKLENWCVVFNWKEHRENIMSNKYTIDVLRDGYVGVWKTPFKIDKKILWDLSDLMKM